jgi:2-phospho-L-lactate guanylyltransferase
MQATVHRFDPATRTGSVVTDAGVVVPFDAEAFATGALRHVRTGQRLTVVVEGEGAGARVVRLALESVGQVPEDSSRP